MDPHAQAQAQQQQQGEAHGQMDPATMAYYGAYGADPSQYEQAYQYQQYWQQMMAAGQHGMMGMGMPPGMMGMGMGAMMPGTLPPGAAARAAAGGRDNQPPSRVLWLGNVGPEITEEDLRAEFAPYGMIESVRLLTHKACAFVTFYEQASSTAAHAGGASRQIRNSQVRVGWGKPDPVGDQRAAREQRDDELHPPCRNLWVGSLSSAVTEEQLRREFSAFGRVEHIKMLPAKNCAFVNFASLSEAQAAKARLSGKVLAGSDRPIRISYGKDDKDRERERSDRPGLGAEGGSGRGPPGPGPERDEAPVAPPAPPPAAPPTNPDVRNIIDKIVGFVVRNGPAFEANVRQKEASNPKFAFLQGGEGSDYYHWRLHCARNNISDAQAAAQLAAHQSGAAPPPPWAQAAAAPHDPPDSRSGSYGAVPPPGYQYQPPTAHATYPPSQSAAPSGHAAYPPPQHYQQHQQQQRQRSPSPPREAPPTGKPLSAGEVKELDDMLSSLTGTKESIKKGKDWLLAHLDQSHDVVRHLRRNMATQTDADRRLFIVYLLNDVLHHCLKKRDVPEQLDTFSDALLRDNSLQLLVRAAHVGQPAKTQERLVTVLKLWADRSIYPMPLVTSLIAGLADKDEPASDDRKRARDDDHNSEPPPARPRRSGWDS